jgi:protein involved in polysaccharide export with SLBB domain
MIAVAQDPSFLPAQQQSQSRQRQQQQAAAAPQQPVSQERDDVAASAARISSMDQLDNSRPLNIKDQIVLRIVEDKAEPKSLMIQDSGDIFAPYIGLVKAAGRTPRALAMHMKAELEKQYFQQATVIVALERAYRGGGGGKNDPNYVVEDMGYITIYGQVIRQGKYEFAPEDQLTASQAILRAGGFAPFAKDKAVKIIRKTPKGNVTIVVNLRDVMTKGRLEKDITILPNDTIIVEEKLINF